MKKKTTPAVPVVKTSLEATTETVLETADEYEGHVCQLYTELAKESEARSASEEFDQSVLAEIASLKRSSDNLLRAQLKVSSLSDELGARFHDVKKHSKRPSNTLIDYEEERSDYFAKGNNIYKLLLVLVITSFIGVVVETIWCFLRNGYIESRVNLVYGPFNLVYGFGGVALTAFLYGFRNRGIWLSFTGGLISGSIVEYLCSFVQEKIFGSTSWDYSSVPLNINGRICLLYSVFWGILGVWWIKSAYPFIAQWLLKIPNKVGKIITTTFAVFLLCDAIVSSAAVYRWSQRQDGVAARNAVERVIDSRFTDSRMKRIYPNLVFSTTD